MKKALILTGFNPFLTTGGIETLTRELAGLLESCGVKVDMVYASESSNPYQFRNEFIGKVYASGRSLLTLRADDYDFVVLNGYYGGGFYPKPIKTFTIFHSTHTGYAEAVKAFVPSSIYLEIRCVIGEMLERTSASGAAIIAVSNRVRSELEAFYGLPDIDVIENPVDTGFFHKLDSRDELRNRYGIPRDRHVGLYVGRWETSKGMDIVSRLTIDMKEIFWVIAASSGGESEPPSAMNVRSFSDLDREQMRDLYSLSDFMVFPSRYEGFGLAAAEAMACGLPVIGSPVGFLEDVYSRPPFSPFSVPVASPGTHEALVRFKASVHTLLSDSALCGQVADMGRMLIEEKYQKALWERKMKNVLCLN